MGAGVILLYRNPLFSFLSGRFHSSAGGHHTCDSCCGFDYGVSVVLYLSPKETKKTKTHGKVGRFTLSKTNHSNIGYTCLSLSENVALMCPQEYV